MTFRSGIRASWRAASQCAKRGVFSLQLAFGKVAPDSMSAGWRGQVRQLLKQVAQDPTDAAIVDACSKEVLETFAAFGSHIDDVLAHRGTLGPQSLKVEGSALKQEGKEAQGAAFSAHAVVFEITRRYDEDYIPSARHKLATTKNARDAARLAELEARARELKERSLLLIELAMPIFRTGMLTDYAVGAPSAAVPDLAALAAFFRRDDRKPPETEKPQEPALPEPDMGHEFRSGVSKDVVVSFPLKLKAPRKETR